MEVELDEGQDSYMVRLKVDMDTVICKKNLGYFAHVIDKNGNYIYINDTKTRMTIANLGIITYTLYGSMLESVANLTARIDSFSDRYMGDKMLWRMKDKTEAAYMPLIRTMKYTIRRNDGGTFSGTVERYALNQIYSQAYATLKESYDTAYSAYHDQFINCGMLDLDIEDVIEYGLPEIVR